MTTTTTAPTTAARLALLQDELRAARQQLVFLNTRLNRLAAARVQDFAYAVIRDAMEDHRRAAERVRSLTSAIEAATAAEPQA